MSSTQVIPADLTQGTQLDSVKINRVPVRVQSDVANYSYNGIVRFTLPNDFSDLRQSYLTFNLQALLNGGTYVRYSIPSPCIFNRARVYLGSQLIEDIVNYNVLRGIFAIAGDVESIERTFTEGTFAAANRAIETPIGRAFSVRLHLESLQRVWALHKLRLPLRIELTIGDAPSILEYDGAAPTTFIVNNLYFNYYSMQVPSEVNAALDAQIAAGQAKVKIHTYDNYNTTAPDAASTTLMLPFKHKIVNCLFGAFRRSTVVSNPLSNNKYINQFQAAVEPIQSYMKIGSQIFPSDKYEMSTGVFRYIQMQTVFNSLMYQDFKIHDRQGSSYASAFPTESIIVPIDTRRDSSPNAALWDNGLNTADSATSSQFGIVFAAAPGVSLSVDVFCKYEATITLLPGGDIMLDN